ncbi:helix-turn-helix transcriptional regulator [Phreatobacter oligotrophus]|nr:helix-turn-helix transcriptional regulator [Phreatobacter oligotrophus]
MSQLTWRDRLRAKIEESGRSMQDISLAAGRSRNYVRSLLTEGKEPGLEAFIQLCDVLGANPMWMIYGGDEDFSAHTELLREYAKLTPEQRAGLAAVMKSMQPPG